MKGMLAAAPRRLYDWTREGRSKAYGHWGRFYESIPMDINSRSFGGEATYRQQFAAASCNMCGADRRLRRATGDGCDLQSAAPGTIIGVERHRDRARPEAAVPRRAHRRRRVRADGGPQARRRATRTASWAA
jgi:hypothetical protein